MRASGILLPVASLPSRYGIGAFSHCAYEFVDRLQEAGQRYWQILPLGQTGFGDSPYQSFSTFAGNPYFIDLEALIAEGLLTREECAACDFGGEEEEVDYSKLYQQRYPILNLACGRFAPEKDEDFQDFCRENAAWLEEYSLYMAIKNEYHGAGWDNWAEPIRLRRPEALAAYREQLAAEIHVQRFMQYQFTKQWKRLKRYANDRGVEIIGDIPIYVAYDSADAWANFQLFQLDDRGIPKAVAGCPPDGFSASGQLWGNPLYDWDYHKRTKYQWWIERIRYHFNLYDVVRIDHFRGFDQYYSIPYGADTAQDGHWEMGPGFALFEEMNRKLGTLRIIAEDLGFVTDGVRRLLEQTGFPGMKILQFAFDSRESSDYLPHHYNSNCVVYTGTHDNNTLQGWHQDISPADKALSVEYLGNQRSAADEVYWDFIRLALSSVADLAIIPAQDYLGLGAEGRINTPSTVGINWKWRMKPGQFDRLLAQKIRRLTLIYGRL